MPDHLRALPTGHLLGEYRIDDVLGFGGFGITRLACLDGRRQILVLLVVVFQAGAPHRVGQLALADAGEAAIGPPMPRA